MQPVPPHTPTLPPPPHVAGEAQVPQLSVPPQPSAQVPQSYPSAPHVVGMQLEVAHLPPLQ
jgi:hypothetical protein